MVKNPLTNAGDKRDACSIPGLGGSLGVGNGSSIHYFCLENPRGLRSLAGYSPWGGRESDTTEPLSTYAATRKGRVSTRQGVRVGTSGMEHKQDWWLSSNPRMKKKKKYIPQSLLTLQTAAAAGFMRGREEMFTPIPPLLPFHPPNNHSPKITPLAFSERGAGGVPSALTQRHFVPGREH